MGMHFKLSESIESGFEKRRFANYIIKTSEFALANNKKIVTQGD